MSSKSSSKNNKKFTFKKGRFKVTMEPQNATKYLLKRVDKIDGTLNEYYGYFKLQNQNTAGIHTHIADIRKQLSTLSKKMDQVLKALQRNA
jgi:hypothetical protein